MSTRPLEDRPDLVRYREDGEPVLSFKAFAYLLGVTEDELRTSYEQQGGRGFFVPPDEWMRRAGENVARLGTTNLAEALYLLAREREAELN